MRLQPVARPAQRHPEDVAACDSAHAPVLADNPLEFVEHHGIEIAILAVRAIVEEIADITSMAPRRSLNRRIIRQQRLRIRDQTSQGEQQRVRGQVPNISNRAILHGIVPPDGTRRRRRFLAGLGAYGRSSPPGRPARCVCASVRTINTVA